MYAVQHDERGIWLVYDQADEVVFQGTRGECEEWLDAQENRLRCRRPQRISRRAIRRLRCRSCPLTWWRRT